MDFLYINEDKCFYEISEKSKEGKSIKTESKDFLPKILKRKITLFNFQVKKTISSSLCRSTD